MDTSFLSDLDKLQLTMKRKIHSKYFGEKSSMEIGVGTVFKDFKMYAPGDDFRKIDWKIYARSLDLYVKRFEEERNHMFHILQDSSGSMNFKMDGSETKFEFASKISLGLIYLTIKFNEKYRYASFADDIEISTSNMGLKKALGHIKSIKPTGKSGIQFAHRYKQNLQSKSEVFLISDLLYSISDIEHFLKLYAKHHVFLIHVVDSVEKDMSIKGSVMVEDLETHGIVKTYFGKKVVNEYKHKFHSHINEIKRLCNKYGVKFVEADTSRPLIDVFSEIIYEM